ncbi:hypothetical protein J1N35_010364 [Gossypium stocksii]|uniref:Uncharacterized protein n=1 Tax=Gossypium stocksii TaxID=47602 RepID=A0A9D3VZU9_9ROSI|nr:hypothetical protein J1N35_010364 [Gossypium stocksii]
MTNSLFRFDDKYISVTQAMMVNDRVLERFTYNLSKSPNTEIHGYLQDARFLHDCRMLRATN